MFTKHLLFSTLASLSLLLAACGDDTEGNSSGSPGDTGGNTGTGGAGTGGDTGTGGGGTGGGGGAGGGSADYTLTKVDGTFATPESCYWDADRQLWYVSNIAPMSQDLTQPDGVGWISRIRPDGVIMDEQWVTGLDTPAGMRIVNGTLYVSNISDLVAIDPETGDITATIAMPGAVLLNDPASVGQNIYVTDTFGNALYSYTPSANVAGLALQSDDLQGPNGLLSDGGKLYVASLVDFDPQHPGPLLTVDLTTQTIAPFGTLTGKLDGIEKDGEDFLVSDNAAAQIIRVTADGSHKVEYDLKGAGVMTIADHGFDPVSGTLCIPDLQGNAVFLLSRK